MQTIDDAVLSTFPLTGFLAQPERDENGNLIETPITGTDVIGCYVGNYANTIRTDIDKFNEQYTFNECDFLEDVISGSYNRDETRRTGQVFFVPDSNDFKVYNFSGNIYDVNVAAKRFLPAGTQQQVGQITLYEANITGDKLQTPDTCLLNININERSVFDISASTISVTFDTTVNTCDGNQISKTGQILRNRAGNQAGVGTTISDSVITSITKNNGETLVVAGDDETVTVTINGGQPFDVVVNR